MQHPQPDQETDPGPIGTVPLLQKVDVEGVKRRLDPPAQQPMSEESGEDERRLYQAADVYNATHDLPLYEWVASLESQNQALQERIEKLSDCLQAILDNTAYAVGEEPYETADRLLSPTQETPFVGTLDETIAHLKEPTQEN